jgi:tetratricopeptide (TPR) repeat protein
VAAAKLKAKIASRRGEPAAAWINDLALSESAGVPKTPESTSAAIGSSGSAEPVTDYQQVVLDAVRKVLGLSDRQAIDPTTTFMELGFDSVSSVELTNRLQELVSFRLSVTICFEFPTPVALARHLRESLETRDAAVRKQDELSDRRSLVLTYYQLGALAHEQHRLGEAESYYRQALDISLASGDARSAARTYHQLGTLAQEQHRLSDAETYYRRALEFAPRQDTESMPYSPTSSPAP